jgi:hypothetical protein
MRESLCAKVWARRSKSGGIGRRRRETPLFAKVYSSRGFSCKNYEAKNDLKFTPHCYIATLGAIAMSWLTPNAGHNAGVATRGDQGNAAGTAEA